MKTKIEETREATKFSLIQLAMEAEIYLNSLKLKEQGWTNEQISDWVKRSTETYFQAMNKSKGV